MFDIIEDIFEGIKSLFFKCVLIIIGILVFCFSLAFFGFDTFLGIDIEYVVTSIGRMIGFCLAPFVGIGVIKGLLFDEDE